MHIALSVVIVGTAVSVDVPVIEWHQLTRENIVQLRPLIDSLQSVVVDAFSPITVQSAFAHHPLLVGLSGERLEAQKREVAELDRQITRDCFANQVNEIVAAVNAINEPNHIALVRDEQLNPVGCIFFEQLNIRNHIAQRCTEIAEGSLESIPEVMAGCYFVHLLVVTPMIQKKGLGRALLFSIFDHLPDAHTLYLTTSAALENVPTQGFYKHLGLVTVLKGIDTRIGEEDAFDREIFVQRYTRK